MNDNDYCLHGIEDDRIISHAACNESVHLAIAVKELCPCCKRKTKFIKYEEWLKMPSYPVD